MSKELDKMLKDPSGIVYKNPERSCKQCKKYPCMKNMSVLMSDPAKYGARCFK